MVQRPVPCYLATLLNASSPQQPWTVSDDRRGKHVKWDQDMRRCCRVSVASVSPHLCTATLCVRRRDANDALLVRNTTTSLRCAPRTLVKVWTRPRAAIVPRMCEQPTIMMPIRQNRTPAKCPRRSCAPCRGMAMATENMRIELRSSWCTLTVMYSSCLPRARAPRRVHQTHPTSIFRTFKGDLRKQRGHSSLQTSVHPCMQVHADKQKTGLVLLLCLKLAARTQGATTRKQAVEVEIQASTDAATSCPIWKGY